MSAPPASARPLVNGYRLQLSSTFGFAEAAATLSYLNQLGVNCCYTSPYLTAGEGSASGYDVCDHGAFHPEFGGEAAFATFARGLADNQLGHMIDVVPNHMGTDAGRNLWWRDVLAYGERSRFARCFDINWRPVKAELRGKVLLPILGKQYGSALADGDIRVVCENGVLVVAIDRHRLPLDPETVAGIDPSRLSVDELHALLERQPYRLAYWRTSADEINYRRFFDVDGLIGLRVELEDVFTTSHALVARLIRDGIVTAIRVDHPDGLARPTEYFERLRGLAPPDRACPIVAEKILVDGERLPDVWGIDGTTGYEFLNVLNGLFVDPGGAASLERTYRRIAREQASFAELAHDAKRHIMATTMASEVQLLADQLNRLSERHPRSRDFTLNSLRRALVEIIASMSVYRTYLSPGLVRDEDVVELRAATTTARGHNRALEGSVFGFIEDVILDAAGAVTVDSYAAVDDDDRASRRRFAERFQQMTGSVFAKAVEDTAFYRYQPLLSCNEVGGDPSRLGRTPEEFHLANRQRAAAAPGGLLATSTHDTKFGEDARARLNVLSELPDEWQRVFRRWRQLALAGGEQDRVALDMNDVYRLHQTIVATWPPTELTGAATTLDDFAERVVDGMRKAVREAKRHTSWLNPDEVYESRLNDVIRKTIRRIAHTPATMRFLRDVARIGVVNSLAQLVLKLGSPGVVDVYQGAELWNLSLVDPDNRRSVDFDLRRRYLDELDPLLARAETRDATAATEVRALLDAWPDGRIKLYVTAAGLRLRRRWPHLVLGGSYEPLALEVTTSPDVVAIRRSHGASSLIVAAPRLVAPFIRDDRWPLGDEAWQAIVVPLPDDLADRQFHNVLTGEMITTSTDDGLRVLRASDLFRHCPVAVLLAA